ncbi:MAG: ABC transporter permease subunit, partial [Gemmata sp.]
PLSAPAYWALAVGYPALQCAVGAVFMWNATRSLRLRDATAGPPPATVYPEPPNPAEPPLLLPRVPARALPPLDSANPVLWKERCVGWTPGWALPTAFKLVGIAAGLAAVLLFATGTRTATLRVLRSFDPEEVERLAPRPGTDSGGWLLVCAGVLAAGRYLLPLAAGLGGAIAGERFRGTLDALLATPLDRRALLRAKVQAHAERGAVFAATAAAAVGMGFIADAGARVGLAAAALALSATGLVIALGAWLTVRCASDVRAFRLLLPVATLAAGWPIGAWALAGAEPGPEALFCGFTGAAGVCAAAGVALWWLAGRALSRGD